VVAERRTPCEVGMIARLWRTHIDPVQAAEYDAFAATYSRPMFAALPGCLAAFFLGTGDEMRSVLSLWTDRASIEALDLSALYRETVTRFQTTGVLREPQTVELFEVTGGTVNAGLDEYAGRKALWRSLHRH
jgi:heme-degrading monooxygenase HmoA